MILTNTYTANLAAFLTVDRLDTQVLFTVLQSLNTALLDLQWKANEMLTRMLVQRGFAEWDPLVKSFVPNTFTQTW
jgi:hypothetical protein